MTPTFTISSPLPLWRRLALPCSLLLNIFLVALICGYMLHRPSSEAPASPLTPGARIWPALAGISARLSQPDAAAFRGTLARGLPRAAASSRDLLAARVELARQVSAEHFDREATRQALMAWRQRWDAFLDDYSDTLVDALAAVSPEGRRELIHAAQRSRGRLIGPSAP